MAQAASAHSVVTLFRSRLRPDAVANGYSELAARMELRARAMPGFVDLKTFTARRGALIDHHFRHVGTSSRLAGRS
jgi:antibiotic biosynthesis monooxygenase (ABM) superfamily enzyme